MNCFPCFTSNKSKRSNSRKEQLNAPQEQVITRTPDVVKKQKADDPNQVDTSNIQAQNFTFRELAVATKNFRQECLMGEGGFGRVYKGTIPATGQVVAVKQLDRNGMQGSKEFLVEVLMLSLLNHENLVKLTGYCADGEQRLLVYEFMPAGSLEKRLLDRGDQAPLDWYSRMKIASSAAKGLWYLHDKANPPVIFRDLKSSNILLDNDNNGKLSDYGLAKLAGKDKMNIVPTRVMGTYGYSAPEYIRTGNLTLKSDVYSFGVVLLELITGRRAIDTTKPNEEQNLVSWAQPIFREPKRYPDMADPLLKNQFPEKDLNQVVAIAAMCLQEESAARPLMSDVVTALSFLSTSPPKDAPPPIPQAPSQKSAAGEGESESESEAGSGDDSSDEEGSRHPQDNGTAQHQVATSAKNHESDDASDAEYDYYENENRHKYSPQDAVETKEFYSKPSRKSSTRSRNETVPSSGHGSSDSEGGMVLSSQKSSRKHSGQKSSKKSSMREGDLSQKSSKKSSMRDRDLSQKSSKKKSSVKILSHKSSTGAGSEEGSFSSRGNASLSRNGSISSSEEESQNRGGATYEHGNASFGLLSSESVHSDHDSNYRFQNGSSLQFDHNSSRGSDVHFDRASMASSSSSEDEGSYRHLNSGASSRDR